MKSSGLPFASGSRQRTCTVQHIADWLAEHHGIHLSTSRLRVHLKRAKLSYQRTSRSLKRKQNPHDVAEQQAMIETFEKKALRG